MIKTEKDLVEIIEKGQSGIYDETAGYIRHFSGRIRKLLELKNPLIGTILSLEIDKLLQIMNPALEKEIQWFLEAQISIKLWVNDLVASNRLLGITNDNVYNAEAFEKAIMEHFFMTKKPMVGARIELSFKAMAELVELGLRRFGN